jgi:hypothetical protein
MLPGPVSISGAAGASASVISLAVTGAASLGLAGARRRGADGLLAVLVADLRGAIS